MARLILIGIILLVMISILLSFLSRLADMLMRPGKSGSDRSRSPGGIERSIGILGVKPGASREEVNEAYRDLVNVWHPDRFAANPRLQKKAEERLKEINAAYESVRSFNRWK